VGADLATAKALSIRLGKTLDSTFETHCEVCVETWQTPKVPIAVVPKVITFSRLREEGHYAANRSGFSRLQDAPTGGHHPGMGNEDALSFCVQ
jgi:hypothetical protein